MTSSLYEYDDLSPSMTMMHSLSMTMMTSPSVTMMISISIYEHDALSLYEHDDLSLYEHDDLHVEISEKQSKVPCFQSVISCKNHRNQIGFVGFD